MAHVSPISRSYLPYLPPICQVLGRDGEGVLDGITNAETEESLSLSHSVALTSYMKRIGGAVGSGTTAKDFHSTLHSLSAKQRAELQSERERLAANPEALISAATPSQLSAMVLANLLWQRSGVKVRVAGRVVKAAEEPAMTAHRTHGWSGVVTAVLEKVGAEGAPSRAPSRPRRLVASLLRGTLVLSEEEGHRVVGVYPLQACELHELGALAADNLSPEATPQSIALEQVRTLVHEPLDADELALELAGPRWWQALVRGTQYGADALRAMLWSSGGEHDERASPSGAPTPTDGRSVGRQGSAARGMGRQKARGRQSSRRLAKQGSIAATLHALRHSGDAQDDGAPLAGIERPPPALEKVVFVSSDETFGLAGGGRGEGRGPSRRGPRTPTSLVELSDVLHKALDDCRQVDGFVVRPKEADAAKDGVGSDGSKGGAPPTLSPTPSAQAQLTAAPSSSSSAGASVLAKAASERLSAGALMRRGGALKLKEGFMLRRLQGGIWGRRYFVLTADGTLWWYHTREEVERAFLHADPHAHSAAAGRLTLRFFSASRCKEACGAEYDSAPDGGDYAHDNAFLGEEPSEDAELQRMLPSCRLLEMRSGHEVLRLAAQRVVADEWLTALTTHCVLNYPKAPVFSDKELTVKWMDGRVYSCIVGENTTAADIVKRLCRSRTVPNASGAREGPLVSDPNDWALFEVHISLSLPISPHLSPSLPIPHISPISPPHLPHIYPTSTTHLRCSGTAAARRSAGRLWAAARSSRVGSTRPARPSRRSGGSCPRTSLCSTSCSCAGR